MSDHRARPKPFPGSKTDVFWDGRLCIHVGECVHARGDLFVAGRKPWAQPDAEGPGQVARIVERCPTGALTYRPKDGSGEESAPAANTIAVSPNGPLYVRGDLRIAGTPENMDGVAFRAALCRCGESSRKPFCDGSHSKAGFEDTGAVGIEGPGTDADGPLEVGLAEDGPLLLRGPVSILSGSGRVAWQGEKCALCRCGKSKNKPFCDGSHRDGFKADGA